MTKQPSLAVRQPEAILPHSFRRVSYNWLVYPVSVNSLAAEVVKAKVSYPFYLGTEDVHSRFLSPTHIYKHTSDLIQLSALLPESF